MTASGIFALGDVEGPSDPTVGFVVLKKGSVRIVRFGHLHEGRGYFTYLISYRNRYTRLKDWWSSWVRFGGRFNATVLVALLIVLGLYSILGVMYLIYKSFQ